MPKLISRLNYNYSILDGLIAAAGILNKDFELAELKSIFQSNHIRLVNHARAGIRIALNSLGLEKGAQVGVMAYNCKTVFNAIKIAGYKSVFIDVNDNFEIDYEDLKRKAAKLDALVVTHLFGMASSIEKIKAIIPNILIVEDCAHAFLSKEGNRMVGLKGDVSVFSIGKGKFPSIGDGGFILINNNNLHRKIDLALENLEQPGLFKELKSIFKNVTLSLLFKPWMYGNFTLPRFKKVVRQKDLGEIYSHHESKILKTNLYLFLKKLKKLPKALSTQRENARYNVTIIQNSLENSICNYGFDQSNCFIIPLLVSQNRNATIDFFQKKGVELGKHFSESLNFAKEFGYEKGTCPNAERISTEIITVPTYYRI